MRLVSLLPADSPQHLDRYQLVGEIASGGMATVYLARLAGAGGFKRFVAIKRLHPHLAGQDEFVQMFLDEARLAAAIHHRNVVPIMEIGDSPAGFYLVMEYVEGVPLSKLGKAAALKNDPVPRPVLLRIVMDALSGLHASHELVGEDGRPLELVHRDCSPENLLVGLDGCTRLTDFGVARARARIHSTRRGAVKGKVRYMAPETAGGEDIDRRADLFGLGAVLWELLAARPLFEGSTEVETLNRLLREPIPRLDEVKPDLPAGLVEVCVRALRRDPEERFATAAEMAAAIEDAVRGSGPAPIASEQTVESFMDRRYGERAAQQRQTIRRWFQGAWVSPSDLPPASNPTPETETAPTEMAPIEMDPGSPRRPDDGAHDLLAEALELDRPDEPAPERSTPPDAPDRISKSPDALTLDRGVAREIERAVKAALSRRGVGGAVVVRQSALELHREDGSPPLAIDIGQWMSQWNLLPDELRERRAESAAERLQKAGGEGRAWVSDDPVLRAHARERLRRRLITAAVLAIGGLCGWWLWSAGFFGRGGLSPSSGGSEDGQPTPSATAVAYEQTGARARRACEAARDRLLSGAAMGVDVEGWVVELWLARAGDLAELRAHPALERIDETGVDELGTVTSGEITVQPLALPTQQAVLIRLSEGYAVPFFAREGRERYIAFAESLADALGASHAGLYARCAHLSGRDVGAWYAGRDRAAALAAMIWTSDESAGALSAIQERLKGIEGEAIDEALRRAGGRESLGGDGGHTMVSLRFPLGGATSATKASRALQAAATP